MADHVAFKIHLKDKIWHSEVYIALVFHIEILTLCHRLDSQEFAATSKISFFYIVSDILVSFLQ